MQSLYPSRKKPSDHRSEGFLHPPCISSTYQFIFAKLQFSSTSKTCFASLQIPGKSNKKINILTNQHITRTNNQNEQTTSYGTAVANIPYMQNRPICPYYGVNDDYCDVGCGYISPHDVNMIIRYCSKQFTECAKYMELADRIPQHALTAVPA